MKIKLSQIKPSPKPIRTTRDEDKIDELAQSIKEQGLIVPIKVRPANEHAEVGYDEDIFYEIVYGHRRLEALRIAGLTETDAIVEGVNDTNALIQSLIENLQREDMEPIDIGNGLLALNTITGWNSEEMERRGIMDGRTIRDYLSLTKESPEIQELISRGETKRGTPEGKVSHLHLRRIQGMDLDKTDKETVLLKAAGENLSADQTRKVAESVAATKDPKMRERLIDAPYSPYTHDPEYAKERADRYGEHDPMALDKTPPLDEAWRLTAEVSMIVDFIKKSRQMYEEIIKMDELGKFSPEARPFLIGKLKSTVKQIQKVIDRLEE